MPRKILHVVTNVSHYDDPTHPTGLWLSELVHAWEVFDRAGYEQEIMSPQGGAVALEPRSLKFPTYDKETKVWHHNPARMALLENTLSPEQVNAQEYDAIFLTGGHAVMFDFPNNEALQRITREIWENEGIVSSVCHGYCGLLNTRLSDGSLLVAGRAITGFAWHEEVLARVSKLVPYNAEAEMIQRGARYEKAKLPFVSFTVTDGRLITGQNPGSARETAQKIVEQLG